MASYECLLINRKSLSLNMPIMPKKKNIPPSSWALNTQYEESFKDSEDRRRFSCIMYAENVQLYT